MIWSPYNSTYGLQPHSVIVILITRDHIAWVLALEPCVTGLACALGIGILKFSHVSLVGSQGSGNREKEKLRAYCYYMVAR